MTCKTDTWTGCYDLNWKGLICDAAFSHPAKYARGLIFRIVEHAIEEGWIQPGQTILDPFGGVGLGALPALQNGLNWVGCELEPRFVELGRQNIDLWNSRFSGMPKWTGEAVLLQGDSRRLAEVVGAAGLVVSSPPYADITNIGERRDPNKSIEAEKRYRANHPELEGIRPKALEPYGDTPGQLGAMKPGSIEAVISSPPFAGNSGGRGEASRNGIDPGLFDRHSGGMKGGTGSDPANLDHLPMGTPPIAIVSSPPYAESLKPETEEQTQRKQARIAKSKTLYDGRNLEEPSAGKAALGGGYGVTEGQLASMVVGSPPFADSVGSDDPDKRGGLFRDEKRRNDTNLTGTYGETEGQLGGMKAGAIISSPPFENQNACNDPNYQTGRTTSGGPLYGDYGSTDGQIGITQGDTFWAAAKTIIDQCYQILPPNGAAIFVVKNYIKNGAEVDFTGQWQALCEACGFETVHIHRAMLVKDNGEQETMAAGHDTTGTTTNLLGEEVTTAGKPMLNKKNIVARKSFFRRLHERKNPHLAIDFESVLCMRKAAQ